MMLRLAFKERVSYAQIAHGAEFQKWKSHRQNYLEFTFLYNRIKSELCFVYTNNDDVSQFACTEG